MLVALGLGVCGLMAGVGWWVESLVSWVYANGKVTIPQHVRFLMNIEDGDYTRTTITTRSKNNRSNVDFGHDCESISLHVRFLDEDGISIKTGQAARRINVKSPRSIGEDEPYLDTCLSGILEK